MSVCASVRVCVNERAYACVHADVRACACACKLGRGNITRERTAGGAGLRCATPPAPWLHSVCLEALLDCARFCRQRASMQSMGHGTSICNIHYTCNVQCATCRHATCIVHRATCNMCHCIQYATGNMQRATCNKQSAARLCRETRPPNVVTVHAACCMLHAACCMLHAACCML